MYKQGESFYPLPRLFEMYGIVFDRTSRTQPSIGLLDKVVGFIRQHYGIDITEYLVSTLYFDKLILNEDRHLNNLGIIRKADGSYRQAPIFDNGLGLLAREQFWGDMDLVYAINRVRYKPFGNKQTRAIHKEYPTKRLRLNKTKAEKLLVGYDNEIYPRYQVKRCKDIIKWQIEHSKGSGIYWELV